MTEDKGSGQTKPVKLSQMAQWLHGQMIRVVRQPTPNPVMLRGVVQVFGDYLDLLQKIEEAKKLLPPKLWHDEQESGMAEEVKPCSLCCHNRAWCPSWCSACSEQRKG